MNRLSIERRVQILAMLTEGNSMRATARMAGCSFNTVSKLLLDVGAACAEFQDRTLRDLRCTRSITGAYGDQTDVPARAKGFD